MADFYDRIYGGARSWGQSPDDNKKDAQTLQWVWEECKKSAEKYLEEHRDASPRRQMISACLKKLCSAYGLFLHKKDIKAIIESIL